MDALDARHLYPPPANKFEGYPYREHTRAGVRRSMGALGRNVRAQDSHMEGIMSRGGRDERRVRFNEWW